MIMVQMKWITDTYFRFYGFKNKTAAKKYAEKMRAEKKKQEITGQQIRVEKRKEGWVVNIFDY